MKIAFHSILPRRASLVAAAILGVTMASASATAAPDSAPAFVRPGHGADAPAGFVEMCARDRELCAAGGDLSAERIRYAAAAYRPPAPDVRLVKSINAQVNRTVRQRHDVGETWQRTGSGEMASGDCEDLAIEKRMRLINAGVAAERMFYLIAYKPRLGLHTVLAVRLDDGDYVLDNLSPHVLRWDKLRYVWLRMQNPGSPMQWSRVLPIDEQPAFASNADDKSSG